MAELEEDIPANSPYHYKNAPGLSLIILMRIYDVQMALLTQQNKAVADRLYDLHSRGGMVAETPFYDPEVS